MGKSLAPARLPIAARRVQPGRSKDVNAPHKCSLCGVIGHRIETCDMPGTARVREMIRRLKGVKNKPKTRRKPKRLSPTSTPSWRKGVAARYSGKDAWQDRYALNRKSDRDIKQGAKRGAQPLPSPEEALREMQDVGYCWKPGQCEECMVGKLHLDYRPLQKGHL